jgi:hypothetical protein
MTYTPAHEAPDMVGSLRYIKANLLHLQTKLVNKEKASNESRRFQDEMMASTLTKLQEALNLERKRFADMEQARAENAKYLMRNDLVALDVVGKMTQKHNMEVEALTLEKERLEEANDILNAFNANILDRVRDVIPHLETLAGTGYTQDVWMAGIVETLKDCLKFTVKHTPKKTETEVG